MITNILAIINFICFLRLIHLVYMKENEKTIVNLYLDGKPIAPALVSKETIISNEDITK